MAKAVAKKTAAKKTSPKADATTPDYSNVRTTMQRHFGIILTDEQIKLYSDQHPITKRDSRDNVCDTIDRDLLIDAIVVGLLGEPWHWPLNMDSEAYGKEFYQKFHDACIAKGIKLDEQKWYKD